MHLNNRNKVFGDAGLEVVTVAPKQKILLYCLTHLNHKSFKSLNYVTACICFFLGKG